MCEQDLNLAAAYEKAFATIAKAGGPIPWLVQIAHCPDKCDPKWDTVIADTSRDAVIVWMETHPGWILPLRLRVAGAAASLRHANGMPMLSREFVITNANENQNS